jgi:glyoxylase-like metal-dependent hydrolase (beta-lactamase superfamily II)
MFKQGLTAVFSSVVISMASVGLLSVAPHAQAQTALHKSQPGVHRMMLGQVEVIALSDGTVPLDTGVLQSTSPSEIERLLNKSFVKSPLHASVNAFLLRGVGDRLILVDAGTAELYGPSLNKLPAALASIGVKPEAITDILVTHIHTDHTGGLMQGRTRAFPNAKVHVEQKEVDFWMSAATRAAAPERLKVYFAQAELKFKPYVESRQVVPFRGATDLFPGMVPGGSLKSQPSAGHTPGHSFYVLESAGQKMVFIGDIVHVPEVQFAKPIVTIAFDVDPDAARETRRQAFADAARHGYLVAAPHIGFPGVGHIAQGAPKGGTVADDDKLYRDIGEYRFYPIPYQNDAVHPN